MSNASDISGQKYIFFNLHTRNERLIYKYILTRQVGMF